MESKVFDVEAAGLTFPFKFYTFDSIQDDLKNFVDQVKQYDMSIYKNGAKFVKTKTIRQNSLLILNSLLT